MVTAAIFGDLFIRAFVIESYLRKYLTPILGELDFASCELDYPTSPPHSNSEIREYYGNEDKVMELASTAEIIICHMPPLTKNVLQQLTKLRVIGCTRTEPVNINVRSATEAGIPIFYAPGRNARAVAEFTVGLIIAECRNIARGHQSLSSGVWRGDLYLYDRAPRELKGQTVGLIGFGHIGSMIPQLLKPFGVRILAYDPYVEDIVFKKKGAKRINNLTELLSESDIVSLHARVTSETIGFIGAKEFNQMKRGTYFINTARGPMVDYDALYQALKNGHLAGAGLETFAVEPPPPNLALLKLENVTLTPHIAGCSKETVDRAVEMVCKDIAFWYSGKTPLNCFNPEVLSSEGNK
jgi:D-3-phosphoglycerate dehydrogenase